MRRSAQATIHAARHAVLSSTLSGLALMFDGLLAVESMRSASRSRRQRVFDHVTTFWAWLDQILQRNESCAQAVTKVQAMGEEAGLSRCSSNTAAYCKARNAMPPEFLEEINAMVCGGMKRRVRGTERWNGLLLKAIDGSSVKLLDTAANQDAYPQPTSQKPGCGFPVMGVTGVLNLSHGGWDAFATVPWQRHDLFGALQLLEHFEEGDLVLADRAFNSYELVALLLLRGAHSLMRLHQKRAKKLDWRKGRRLGRNQRIVEWKKPAYRANGLVSTEQWASLPDTMSIRLVRTNIVDRSGKKIRLIVATTLLDNDTYNGGQLVELYARRWEIELRLRDVKTTLAMEEFHIRTPATARKTLLMVMIAYNLLKSLIQAAGQDNAIALNELSFKGTLDSVLAYEPRYRGRQRHHRLRRQIFDQLLDTVADKILDIRPFRHEPRAVKRRPKPYQLLTAPRAVFREIPHKARYRKSTQS